MKIKPITAEAAAPTSSGASATTVSGSTCVMVWNSGSTDRLVTVETGAFGVASITISAAGTGYSAGILTATGGGGTGFSGAITVGGSGEITAATVTNAGQGYTSVPTIEIKSATLGTNAGGGNATLAAVLGTAVTKGSFTIGDDHRLFVEKNHSDKMFAANIAIKFTGVGNQ
jgi:hypothetical protein